MPKPVVSLPKAIERLRDSSTLLNRVTDEAANLIKQVEHFLNHECSLGIPASVEIDSRGTWCEWLEYRRVGPYFRIAVVMGDVEEGPENFSIKPWSECSRKVKLDSIDKIPELINKISENVDEKLAKSQNTIASLSKLLNGKQEK